MHFREFTCIFILAAGTLTAAECPENFEAIGSGCFHVEDSVLTAAEAQIFCQGIYGELAKLSDCATFTAVATALDADGSDTGSWIGGTYSETLETWQWRDGSAMTMGTPYWGAAEGRTMEPDSGTAENCAVIFGNASPYFGDRTCSYTTYSLLCETAPSTGGICTLPYVAVGNKCLYFNPEITSSWYDAQSTCQEQGGDLLILKDCDEHHIVVDYVWDNGLEPGSGYWIGATDEAEEDTWLWIDGSSVAMGLPSWGMSYSRAMLPDNSTLDRCVEMEADLKYRFNDLACSELRRPLCMALPVV